MHRQFRLTFGTFALVQHDFIWFLNWVFLVLISPLELLQKFAKVKDDILFRYTLHWLNLTETELNFFRLCVRNAIMSLYISEERRYLLLDDHMKNENFMCTDEGLYSLRIRSICSINLNWWYSHFCFILWLKFMDNDNTAH